MHCSIFQDTDSCSFCPHKTLTLIHSFHEPPKGETILDTPSSPYLRHLVICDACRHVRNIHNFDFSKLYQGSYWQSTYNTLHNNLAHVTQQFQKIINLDPSLSDNKQRVARVQQFFQKYNQPHQLPQNMLDIGSGLAVFTALLKNQNWQTSIIDPDPVAIQHAHNQSATHHTLNAQFPSNTLTITQSLPAPFSLISLNKVLEHNLNPVPILQAVLPLLHTHGLVYIELPDAENALLSKLAHMRNEFFLEHFHAFSFSSINALIHQAGFFPLQIERILEPSGKYTLFAFMTPQASKIS